MRTAPFDLITVDDVVAADNALNRLNLLNSDETVESMERAGEGNMNLVVRITTNRRTLILKQSRPWVEKYPQIDAPDERILAEIDFYRRTTPFEAIRDCMPVMYGFDADARIMVLEDLGAASDYSELYQIRQPEFLPLAPALSWLAQLHAVSIAPSERERIGIRSLRQLNHAHIFVIPLQTPAVMSLDAICAGMDDLASRIRSNARVSAAAMRYGDRYLGSGDQLLHGDFYPGSWLRTTSGLRIIDPEFCFAGPAEFDLGVLAAHRVFVGGGAESADLISNMYQKSGGKPIDNGLLRGFAGMEIIRRLIGVAQLPLTADFDQRLSMIETALGWLDA